MYFFYIKSTDSRSFIAIAYAGVFVISTVWYLSRNKKFTFLSPAELVLMDKWATSMGQVSAFIDEIMALPYHAEMRKHYK